MKIFYTFLTFTCLTSITFAQCDEFMVDVSYTDPLCPNYADGSVTAIPTGGTEPYTIFITDEDEFIRNPDGGSETGNLLHEGLIVEENTGQNIEFYSTFYGINFVLNNSKLDLSIVVHTTDGRAVLYKVLVVESTSFN